MQKTLYGLIELQEVDHRLDELMEERGDLPLIVNDLKAKLDTKKNDLTQYLEEKKKQKLRQKEVKLTIEEAKAKLEKYEEQLYQVRTNKEYDAITNETDAAKEQMEKGENELNESIEEVETISENISALEAEIKKIEEELEENTIELNNKMTATSEEENLLRQERDIIVKKTDLEIIKNYEMVREARGGQGVAKIKGNVCGGCFSYIPPQKIVEVKRMIKIYTCEFCGRILVLDESK